MPSFRLGGQTVTVEANDLAQENTLKNMAQDISNLAAALGAVKSEDAKTNAILGQIRRQQKVDNDDEDGNTRSITASLKDLKGSMLSLIHI